jgi:VCBS repeat-containing protein
VLGGTTGTPICDQGSPEIGLAANTLHRHRLDWLAPTIGAPPAYNAYRVWDPTGEAEAPTPTSVVDLVATTSATTLIDREELPNGKRFIYWVRGLKDGQQGSLSNYAIVTAENTAPVANDDTGYTLPKNSKATTFPTVLANDTDVDSARASLVAVLVARPRYGTVALHPDGTFTYTPNPNFTGTDTFTYQANNGVFTRGASTAPMSPNSNTATVTITVTDVPVVVKPHKTDVWLTTTSSRTKFDLKAEVLKNGEVVATGTLTHTTLGDGDKPLNKEIVVESGAVSFASSDTLSVRVSIKLSNVYEGAASGGDHERPQVRLYYNIPTPPATSSHLHATRDSADVVYHLIKNAAGLLALQRDGTVPGPTNVVEATVTSRTTYTPIATWSVTGP